MNSQQASPDAGTRSKTQVASYQFEEFTFDPVLLELKRGEATVPLKLQPAKLLLILLEHAPDIAPRKTLQDRIWDNGTIVEFDQGLNACIRQLRTALEDTANAPRFVETLPKRGYRFVAPVKRVQRIISHRHLLWAAIAAMVIVSLTLVTFGDQLVRPQDAPVPIANNDPAFFDAMTRAKKARQLGGPGSMRESLSWYEKALSLDPNSPGAKGGKAIVLAVLAGRPDFPAARTYRQALKLSDEVRADSGPTMESALARGYVALYRDWDLATARLAVDEAVALSPEDAMARSWRAAVLGAQGDIDGALQEASRAVTLDPLAMAANADRCWYLTAARKFEDAVSACQLALESSPGHFGAASSLITSLDLLDRDQEALDLLTQILNGLREKNNKGGPSANGDRASQPTTIGDAQCALAALLKPQAEKHKFPMVGLAAFQAGCGNFKAAGKLLARAKEGGESGVLFYPIDPRFDEFRASEFSDEFDLAVSLRRKTPPIR